MPNTLVQKYLIFFILREATFFISTRGKFLPNKCCIMKTKMYKMHQWAILIHHEFMKRETIQTVNLLQLYSVGRQPDKHCCDVNSLTYLTTTISFESNQINYVGIFNTIVKTTLTHLPNSALTSALI
jgi:hypothetical protein